MLNAASFLKSVFFCFKSSLGNFVRRVHSKELNVVLDFQSLKKTCHSYCIEKLWNRVDVVDVTNKIVVTQEFDTGFNFFSTCTSRFTNELSVNEINIKKKIIELQLVVNFRNVSPMNTLKF